MKTLMKHIHTAANSHINGLPFKTIEMELSFELMELFGGRKKFILPKWTDEYPAVFSNFIQSIDGRISFGIKNRMHAGYIAGINKGDKFLMGLLRTFVSLNTPGIKGALMNGAQTLNNESDVILSAAEIYPAAADIYRAYLESQGQEFQNPPVYFITGTGRLNLTAEVFKKINNFKTHVVTSSAGAQALENIIAQNKQENGSDFETEFNQPEIIVIGRQGPIDLKLVMQYLRQEKGINLLLTEGGARLYSSLHEAKLLQIDFNTQAPLLIGSDQDDGENSIPLSRGYRFLPETAPRYLPLGMQISTEGDGFVYRQFARVNL